MQPEVVTNGRRSHNTYVQRRVNVPADESDSVEWHDLVLPMSDGTDRW